jgi:queuosine precursor transporter
MRNSYRYFTLVTAIFVTTLITSNIMAVKLVQIGGMILPAAVIIFPISYIFGDILTEVYGYARARQTIWIGFLCNLIAVIAFWLAGLMPAAPIWTAGIFNSPETAQQAYQAILGFAPRLLLASFAAYLVGEFLNSFVLAKLKVRTGGKYLWMRTIGSTLVGQAADSAVFITIAFVGIIPLSALSTAVVSQWIFKVVYEILATPLTYLIVNRLKRSEGIDTFDRNTDFSPVSLKET